MYKIVAFKPGFVPAVEMLLRRHDESQKLEIQLLPEGEADLARTDDADNEPNG